MKTLWLVCLGFKWMSLSRHLSVVCIVVFGLVLANSICSAESAGTPDPRLEQKVTYAGGYKRLHDITNDLSRQTRITIRAGRTAKDWRVGDLPVTIYAKDLPLGKLLRVLAAACRATLTSSTSGSEKTYRIWFTDDQIQGIQDIRAKEHVAAVASVEWVWDSLLKCVDIPDSAFREQAPDSVSGAKLMGRMLASLGQDAKRRVLNGEPLLVTEEWREAVRDFQPALEPPRGPGEPSVDVKRSSLLMWPDEGGKWSGPGLRFRFISEDGTPSHYAGQLGGVGPSWFADPQTGISDPPKWPKLPKDPVPKGFALLSDEPDFQLLIGIVNGEKTGNPVWRSPLLSRRIKLELPKDSYTLADVLLALSKASACSIICEDFASHRQQPPPPTYISDELADKTLRTETSIGEKLIALEQTYNIQWMIDGQSGTILGRPMFYVPLHANLMPEAVLVGLKAKSDGPGLELDEVVDLGQYSEGQTQDWISGSRDLSYIPVPSLHARTLNVLYFLYAKLSTGERKLARSESGFPLSSLDPAWLSGFFKSEGPTGRYVLTSNPLGYTWDRETAAAFQTLAEPSSYSTLTLHVRRVPEPARESELASHHYVFSLDGLGVLKSEMSGFPIYSPKRAAAIRERAGDKTARP